MATTEDAAYLRAFEELVQSQQPASEPWQPVTDYSLEVRKAIEGKHPRLIKETFKPRRVLDVGCGKAHLVGWLRQIGVNAYGCDISIPIVNQPAHLFYLDIAEPLDYEDHVNAYSLVICREVLEHLTIKQIRQAVANLCALSSRFVYVTTRINTAATHMLDVATRDDLDPTHISILPDALLRTLFVLEGVRRRPDLEARLDWQRKGRCFVYEHAADDRA